MKAFFLKEFINTKNNGEIQSTLIIAKAAVNNPPCFARLTLLTCSFAFAISLPPPCLWLLYSVQQK